MEMNGNELNTDKKGLKAFVDMLHTKNDEDAMYVKALLEDDWDGMVWYVGSAEDIRPCYFLESVINDGNKYFYFFIDSEYQAEKPFFRDNNVYKTYGLYNREIEGTCEEAYGRILNNIDVSILGKEKEVLVPSNLLDIEIDKKTIHVLYMNIDMKAFMDAFIVPFSLEIKWLFYLNMNNQAFGINMLESPKYALPEKIVINRKNEIVKISDFSEEDKTYRDVLKTVWDYENDDVRLFITDSTVKRKEKAEMKSFGKKLKVWVDACCEKCELVLLNEGNMINVWDEEIDIYGNKYYRADDPDVGYKGIPYWHVDTDNDEMFFVIDEHAEEVSLFQQDIEGIIILESITFEEINNS